jgi:hypothetical protein
MLVNFEFDLSHPKTDLGCSGQDRKLRSFNTYKSSAELWLFPSWELLLVRGANLLPQPYCGLLLVFRGMGQGISRT